MKKSLLLSALCLLAPITQAQTDTCLADLTGTYFQAVDGGTPQSELVVKNVDGEWQFSLPADENSRVADRLFRYNFDRYATLSAKPFPPEHLPYVGPAMLARFVDKRTDLQNIVTECGLMVDDIFLARIDISRAPPQLFENILLLSAATSKQPNPTAGKASEQIAQLRKKGYFLGTRFVLEGVTAGIVAFPMRRENIGNR